MNLGLRRVRTVLLPALLFLLAVLLAACGRDTSLFQEKAALLREEALADWVREELGRAPAGEAGHAVFLSVCDGTKRADVYTGTGETLDAAWEKAVETADKALRKSGMEPRWVKADLVYLSSVLPAAELGERVKGSRDVFYRYGAALDRGFETALLEAELNSAKIYEYDHGGVDLKALNRYLEQAGRKTLETLPEEYVMFQCAGWICGESKHVVRLSASGLNYGRRQPNRIDANYAKTLILESSAFLADQVKEDGAFVYGIYPRFDKEIQGYNILRHAGAVWALICRYRMAPDASLAAKIDQAVGYLLTQICYDGEGRAYLYEAKSDEVKLGGCGIAVVALTEYMDVFQNKAYQEVCEALGEGILSMLDLSKGTYYHVLNGDFSRKEEFRTVYYDGEATFALCRLYGLTGERKWLDAAERAVQHFIAADYSQYRDHWVSYSLNEMTKYLPERAEYYAFGLENAQRNLEAIASRETTGPTDLELLMAAFELYVRMTENGGQADGFDLAGLLQTISARVERQQDGWFYPEYAMYMENPQRILNTFMVRNDGFRVRIDDVQHNIGGFYLYYKNYETLVAYGLQGVA